MHCIMLLSSISMVFSILGYTSCAKASKQKGCKIVQQECSSDDDLYEQDVCKVNCCSKDRRVRMIRADSPPQRSELDIDTILRIIKHALCKLNKCLCKILNEESACLNNELGTILGTQNEKAIREIQNEIIKANCSIETRIGDATANLTGYLSATGASLTDSIKKITFLATKAAHTELLAKINAVSLLPDADIVLYVKSTPGLKTDIAAAIDKINAETQVATEKIIKDSISQLIKEVTTELKDLRKAIKKIISKLEGRTVDISQISKAAVSKANVAAITRLNEAVINKFDSATQQTLLSVAIFINQASRGGSKDTESNNIASILLMGDGAERMLRL